jgi:hypothetical protein
VIFSTGRGNGVPIRTGIWGVCVGVIVKVGIGVSVGKGTKFVGTASEEGFVGCAGEQPARNINARTKVKYFFIFSSQLFLIINFPLVRKK